MADELVNMSSQFKGLPMGDLIGGPLDAACDAQVKLARATADFIRVIGFLPPDTPDPKNPQATGATRTASFRFKRPVDDPDKAGGIAEEDVELEVPLLAIVNVPSLSIQTVDITFDMEVKSSFSSKEKTDASASLSADVEYGFGLFKAKVHIQGSVSTSKENTRSSDNSAKYHVSVHAADKGPPEGLARVLDILQTSVAPRKIGKPIAVNP
ncbi:MULTISPECIES: DUF2589 domain-containing protein [Xanthomonas]|uniref:DUF2589 domain-containing protein n=1 Tax=Xanthomonas rydalmerensis TaxID=3046274 RepID=A0ABZ0JU04_9XANT|nr:MULTISPECIES: DUF2589 domain-containing protein [unclassified Xanthomonas]MBB5876073.1 hypothetical protein [Xanthomonas sp. 3498]WOS42577.1 DUF2589 domain-containing protein [Xanthomonas sp. DM-2023]WOS46763.1 DUF2589 domain-containing protein [Xanthomonas sp. DM-2023]WOS50943.1 DUF2589 domain-containing protein [Xanthomonas sp. DM-2023]WOS55123.1 DUF2589 domain-containing protein [Xanthomonas sp. DM-2023]